MALLRSVFSRVATLLPSASSGLSAMFARGMATTKRKRVVMGRAYRGLYDGKHIGFGNKISFAGNKSRRSWKPNIVNKRFWSQTYQRMLSFRVATSVIKKVRKLSGGIDQYLLTTPNDLLLYKKAIAIKKNIITLHERVAAGLPILKGHRAAHLLQSSAGDAPEASPSADGPRLSSVEAGGPA